jgi:HEPN domain-containing protein
MNRTDFQRVAKTRIEEARALLDGGHYPGAYYLVGYAVECAIKACVAKQVKRYDFPDKKVAKEAYTHDLSKLVLLAGLGPDFEKDRKSNSALDLNWAVVKDWDEESRYDTGITAAQAQDLFSACTERQSGILTWVEKRW